MTEWETYLAFVRERHAVWERRTSGHPAPWSEDEILRGAKFTNVYRVLDPGSQFLLRELLRPAEGDLELQFALAMLYRYTNRTDAWEYFHMRYDRYPTLDDLYCGRLAGTWTTFRESGGKLQSTAYRVFAHPNRPKGQTYIDWLCETVKLMLRMDVPERVCDLGGSVREQVDVFGRLPRCGDFMGMQILTDLGYAGAIPDHDEDSYAVPGIGAKTGAAAVGLDPDDAIRRSWEWHNEHGDVHLHGLPPSMMDIQNTFCEFGKYARMDMLGKVTMPFRVTTDRAGYEYVLPARWGNHAFELVTCPLTYSSAKMKPSNRKEP